MQKPRVVTLSNGNYTARIDLDAGANCISLRNAEYDAILLREPIDLGRQDNPFLYGMPILFPVNRISNGRFVFEGREYSFHVNEEKTGCHLHGTLYKSAFSLKEADESKAIFTYHAYEAQPYHGFPHEFEVCIEYELTENGLRQTVRIKNLSSENMPVMLGFHTTFNALFTEQSRPENIFVRVPIAEEYERNMENYLPTGKIPELDSVSRSLESGQFNPFLTPVSRHYRGASKNMVIYDAGRDLSLIYENDDKYPFRLIYNGNADGYICLEPQTCIVNSPNAPFSREFGGFDWLPSGKSKSYTSRIYLAKGDHR